MEKVHDFLGKVKKLSASFAKDVDGILKRLTDPDKTKLQLDLEVCQLYENIMQANLYLCEVKCMICQMRHDLFMMKEESEAKLDPKKKKEKKEEKEKLVLLLYNAEEAYDERKKETIKILVDIVENGNKRKFTLDEIELWKEAQNFIKTNVARMNM